jgi:class 3 adenylate cyclase
MSFLEYNISEKSIQPPKAQRAKNTVSHEQLGDLEGKGGRRRTAPGKSGKKTADAPDHDGLDRRRRSSIGRPAAAPGMATRADVTCNFHRRGRAWEMAVKRRLAALLSADVAGYSRMVRDNEEAAVAVLRAHRAVFDPLIAQYGGRVVNTAGDSVLAEFASPVEAVRCALEVQEALGTRNAELAEQDRMWFRIGINLGDVMVQDNGDLLGDGVNIAARLQALADPGGICISNSMREQIENKVALVIDDLGDQMVKNIPQPIRVYRLRPGDRAAAAAHPSTHAPRRRWLAAVAGIALAGGLGGGAWSLFSAQPGAARFDGIWGVTIVCPAGADGVSGYTMQFDAQVKDGEFHGQYGAEGAAGSLAVSGTLQPDGTALLNANGLTGDPARTIGRLQRGSPYAFHATARFEASRGTGRRVELRPCDLTFVKQ